LGKIKGTGFGRSQSDPPVDVEDEIQVLKIARGSLSQKSEVNQVLVSKAILSSVFRKCCKVIFSS
jgi:hypothetical protein